jgi:cytochrome c oxidase subunit 3
MSHADIVTPTPAGFAPHKVAHHYDSHVQEFQSCKLAFWLFLATEILLFGGMFAAYFVYHGLYPETFKAGGKQLNWVLGALNTTILLASSYTMAMGVRACQLSKKKAMLTYLALTVLGAVAFLVVKYFEYSAKFEHGLAPGFFFHPHGEYAAKFANLPHPNLYFSFYFTMTGIHGLHVVIGAVLILWVMAGGAKGKYHSGHFLPVDLVGLYWHLVDLIWIFLFPLLYLVP